MSWLSDYLNKKRGGTKLAQFSTMGGLTGSGFTQLQNAIKQPQPVATPITTTDDTQSKLLASQNRAREMELLRQGLGQQRLLGQQNLRHSLASRGILGSGSEWRGMSDINQQTGNLMAQGALKSAMGESSALQDIQKQAVDRNFQREMMQKQIEAQLESEKRNKPEWWEYLLGTIGQVGSAYLGGLAGRPSGGGYTASGGANYRM